jgi:hypothetical protein
MAAGDGRPGRLSLYQSVRKRNRGRARVNGASSESLHPWLRLLEGRLSEAWGSSSSFFGREASIESDCHSHTRPPPSPPQCMSPVRFTLRGPCKPPSAPLTKRPPRTPQPAPRLLPPLLRSHARVLSMDPRQLSEGTPSSSHHGLKLTNRLAESRSPYVSASPAAPMLCALAESCRCAAT